VREVARLIGRVSQEATSTYGFTALEIVVMGRYPHMGRFQVEGEADREIALEAMRQTDIVRFADRPVASLSGGERQRVFIARALAQQPHILLLDEPTANLDIQHQLRVLEIVRQAVDRGITAVAAIHDLSLAARYCDRLVLLTEGRVLAEGSPERVMTSDNIEAAYGVRIMVYPDPLTGSLTLSLPEPSLTGPVSQMSGRVHVVCGGGSGARLMYELWRAGFSVTAGPLGAGDTDRMAADIIGVPYLPLPAFGPIDDETHQRHGEMVASADVTILCDMPIGTNNLRNLEAVTHATRLVTIESTPLDARDLMGGEAGQAFGRLRPVARCSNNVEAVAAIRRLEADGSQRVRVP
jgi:iron complex transport system ATP-binding protein